MATIKELAESIGISKVGLTKWIERNGYKGRLEKVGNKYIVPADIEQAVRSYFDHRDTKPQKVVQNTNDTEKEITAEILALLREQLETKDREIERLHQQVDDLQKINADMTKAVRELNTIQAMLLTDGSGRVAVENDQHQRTGREQVENDQRTASEQREQSKSEARERTPSEPRETASIETPKKSFWQRLKGKF